MSNIWLDTKVLSNHKIKKLIRIAGHEGFTCLLRLWIFAAEHRSTGKLTGLDEEDITDVCEWSDESCGFPELLIKCNLLEIKHGVYYIHDFIENNPYIAKAKARSDAARKAAKARWEEPCDGNATAMQPQSTGMSDVMPKKRKEKKRKEELPPAAICSEIIKHLNEKSGRKFDVDNEEHYKIIRLRWKKYPDIEKFKFVIDACCGKWKDDDKMRDYLQPSTLFNGKFGEKLGWTLQKDVDHRTTMQIKQDMEDAKNAKQARP